MLKHKLTTFFLLLSLLLPFSSLLAGTVLASHKFAWSNNVGYINFGAVLVNSSGLSGYAWSTNKGFINFSPTIGGVLNDGTGNLSGSAWGEQLGWIDFNNVSIDGNGKFTGTATGDLVGTITFDCPNFCDVETDWRQSLPPASPQFGGGNGPPVPNPVPNPVIEPLFPDTGSTVGSPSIVLDSSISNKTTQQTSQEDVTGINFAENPFVALESSEIHNSNIPEDQSADFDVISEQIQEKKQSPFSIFLSIILVETLITALGVLVAVKIIPVIIKK